MHQLILLLCLFLVLSNGVYPDDWIDPTDMLNYDAASGRMRSKQEPAKQKAEKMEPQEEAEKPYLAQMKEYEKIVENLNMQLQESIKKEKLQSPQSNSQPLFRRYLRKIIKEMGQLGLPDNSQPVVYYDAEVVLTVNMLAEIYKFLDGTDWNVGALDEALSTMFVQFRYHNEKNWKWKFEDYFGVEAYTVFMVLLCLLCVVSLIATELWSYVGWFVQLKRLFVLSIVVSLGWNWLYLCKVAFAERQAEIAKMGKFDDKCGEKVTWYDSFLDYLKGSVTFRNDPCEEYYKALMIDPVLLVPPTKALAVTFTNFITEPLKHIGKGIGEFLNALLSEIPLAYQAPVLIFIAVVFLGFWYGAGKAFVAVHRDRNLPGPERDRHLPDNPQRPNQDRFIENVNPLPPQNQLLQGEGDRGNVQNTVDGNRWPSQNQLQEGKSEVNLNQRRPRLMDKKGDQRSRTDFEHNRMYITPGNTVAAQVNDQYNNEDNRQSSYKEQQSIKKIPEDKSSESSERRPIQESPVSCTASAVEKCRLSVENVKSNVSEESFAHLNSETEIQGNQ